MYDTIRTTDKFINRFSWNTLLKRDGKIFSVNHYRAQTFPTIQPDRMEIRYEVKKQKEWEQLGYVSDPGM